VDLKMLETMFLRSLLLCMYDVGFQKAEEVV